MTRSGGDFQPRPLKRLFTTNQCWTSFLDAGGLRDIEVEAVAYFHERRSLNNFHRDRVITFEQIAE